MVLVVVACDDSVIPWLIFPLYLRLLIGLHQALREVSAALNQERSCFKSVSLSTGLYALQQNKADESWLWDHIIPTAGCNHLDYHVHWARDQINANITVECIKVNN